MNIQITVDGFNPDKLASVSKALRQRGLTIKQHWLGDLLEPTTPDHARIWKITTPDECLVSQEGNRLKVEATGRHRRLVLAALVSQGIVTAPQTFQKGLVWVLLYVILQILAGLAYSTDLLQIVLYVMLGLLITGHVLARVFLNASKPGWPMVLAYALMAPSLVLTFPVSLLNTRTIRQYIRARNHMRGRAYMATE